MEGLSTQYSAKCFARVWEGVFVCVVRSLKAEWCLNAAAARGLLARIPHGLLHDVGLGTGFARERVARRARLGEVLGEPPGEQRLKRMIAMQTVLKFKKA